MKSIKKYLTLVLALALCLSMTACGSDNVDEDNLYNVPDSFEGLVKDSEQMSNLYVYGGAWRGEDDSTMIVATSESGDEVRFALYDADEVVTASGFIQFVPEYDYDYFYNEHDGVAYRSWFDEVGAMYVASIGTFTKLTGDAPGENIGDGDYGFLAGVWYQDGEPGAASIIEFDATGSWTLSERPGGDGDPTVVDSGTLEVDPDGAGTYFAVSDMYEDVVYDMLFVGDDVIYWGGEYDYYQKMA